MSGRLPATDTLTTTGAAAQAFMWAVLGLDQDYEIIEAGLMPDPGSQAGQLQGLIATFRGGGGSVFSGGAPSTGYISHATGLQLAAQFGSLAENLLSSPFNANSLSTLYAGATNVRFYRDGPKVSRDDFLVILVRDANADTGSPDAVARACIWQVVARPIARQVA